MHYFNRGGGETYTILTNHERMMIEAKKVEKSIWFL